MSKKTDKNLELFMLEQKSVFPEVQPWTQKEIMSMSWSKSKWFYGLVRHKRRVVIAEIKPGAGYSGVSEIMWVEKTYKKYKKLSGGSCEKFGVSKIDAMLEAFIYSMPDKKEELMKEFKPEPGELTLEQTMAGIKSGKIKTTPIDVVYKNMALKDGKCFLHPKYKAKRKPKYTCVMCDALWEQKQKEG